MPAQHLYPGVYIEEIPSGVHTIVGVSTSDTAFIDFFKRGPLNKAVRVESFNDFERNFGGLDTRSEASYAIYQYYLNGGSAAWVVRVASGAIAATVTLRSGYVGSYYYGGSIDVAKVTAASPGVWGNHLWVSAQRLPVKPSQPDKFNFLIQERALDKSGTVQVVNAETFLNLSMDKNDPRYAVDVIAQQSALVTLADDNGIGMVPDTGTDGSGKPSFVQLGLTAQGDTAGYDGDEPGGSGSWDGANGANALTGGLPALDAIAPQIFNILCIPAAAEFSSSGDIQAVYSAAMTYVEAKRAFLIVDMAPNVKLDKAKSWVTDVGLTPSKNASIYYPRLNIPDALNEYRARDSGPSGTLAGIYARTDATRGVWKAPAGMDASLRGAEVITKLTDDQDGDVNPFGVNGLRSFPIFGNVCWGARTLEGADQQASEWKYIPVRRLALYIEETLFENTKWVVFEPNDEPLWAQIRLNVGAFMHDLFRQGAFQGQTPKDAYFVKCDSTTTTPSDVNQGVVNILVGFAPLKPAEFVVIKIQQIAGQIPT